MELFSARHLFWIGGGRALRGGLRQYETVAIGWESPCYLSARAVCLGAGQRTRLVRLSALRRRHPHRRQPTPAPVRPVGIRPVQPGWQQVGGCGPNWRITREWSALCWRCVSRQISETGSIRPIAEIRYFLTHIALVGAGVLFHLWVPLPPAGAGDPAQLCRRPPIRLGHYSAQPVSRNQLFFYALSTETARLYPRLPALALPSGRLRHLSHCFRSDAPALRVAAAGRRSRVRWLIVAVPHEASVGQAVMMRSK